jgi:hypothetical protein
VRTVGERLESVEDPWKTMGRSARSLAKAAKKLGIGG